MSNLAPMSNLDKAVAKAVAESIRRQGLTNQPNPRGYTQLEEENKTLREELIKTRNDITQLQNDVDILTDIITAPTDDDPSPTTSSPSPTTSSNGSGSSPTTTSSSSPSSSPTTPTGRPKSPRIRRSRADLEATGVPKVTVNNARVIAVGKIVKPASAIKMSILYNGQRYDITAPLKHRHNIKPGSHVDFTAYLENGTFLYSDPDHFTHTPPNNPGPAPA